MIMDAKDELLELIDLYREGVVDIDEVEDQLDELIRIEREIAQIRSAANELKG